VPALLIVTQEWLHASCPEMIEKDQWPPNSPDLNPLDYHVCVWGGAMLEKYYKLQPKPKTIAELKDAMQSVWDDATGANQEGSQGLHKTPEGMRSGQGWTL